MSKLLLAVIDLDQTLYDAGCGIFARMDRRINAFIMDRLGVSWQKADRLRLDYWRRYGSTLRGLMLHHGIDPEPYLCEVHDVQPEELIKPDPALDAALGRIAARKVIHTNAIAEYAERVLAALGIRHHFAAIYDIRFDGYRPKPNRHSLLRIIEREGAVPERTLVVDDQPENLEIAKALGCKTIRICHEPDGRWDFHLVRPHQLPEAIASLLSF